MTKEERKNFIKIVALNVILMLVLLGIKSYTLNVFHGNVWTIDSWDVTYNDKQLHIDKSSEHRLGLMKKGDHIEMITTLNHIDSEYPVIKFTNYCFAVDVYLGEDVIYSFGSQEYQNGDYLGSGDTYVSLPNDYAGKQLKLVIDVGEDDTFTTIPEITVRDGETVVGTAFSENFFSVFVGLVLFVFALVGVIVSLSVSQGPIQRRMMLCISGFAVSIALWVISMSGVLSLFANHSIVVHEIGYISLFLAPVFLIHFIHYFIKMRYLQKVLNVMTLLCLAFALFAIVANETNYMHYSQMVNYYQIIIFMFSFIALILGTRHLKRANEAESKYLMMGILIFVIFVVVDNVRFLVSKTYLTTMNERETLIPMAVLVLVIVMSSCIALKIKSMMVESLEKTTLMKMAFTDALCHIHNRASCEKKFREYEESQHPVLIIQFDLNHFKAVNDQFGHAVGDQLLIRFSQMLQQSFPEGFVGRMGGDEFIVIMDYKEDISEEINNLFNALKHFNNSNQSYQISCAYGYFENYHHPEYNVWKVYEEADHRMYENKKKYKNTLQYQDRD